MINKVSFIIPARGGSKGIKNKNIKDFYGEPLIAWQIKAALNTGLGNIFVSSDSTRILEVANKYGAIPIKRPVGLAQDNSSSEDAIINCVDEATKQGYDVGNTIIFLQATSPWLTSRDIIGGYLRFLNTPSDSLIFGVRDHSYNGLYFSNTHLYLPSDDRRLMRQEMDLNVKEVGAYIFDYKVFVREHNRLCGTICAYVLDHEVGPEIDSMLDWVINDIFFKEFCGNDFLT